MFQIKIIKENFIEVFSNWKYTLFTISFFIILTSLFLYFSNFDIIIGNYGYTHFYIVITTQILISLLFSIFLALSGYKFITFSSYSPAEQSTSSVGAFFGILITGCASCSVTLASYLGLVSLISFLPYHGLELNIISVILLLISTYFTAKNLKVCKFKFKKRK